MPNDLKGTTIDLNQIRIDPTKINQYIEERIAASPQVSALVSTLTELVPGFEESYQGFLSAYRVPDVGPLS